MPILRHTAPILRQEFYRHISGDQSDFYFAYTYQKNLCNSDCSPRERFFVIQEKFRSVVNTHSHLYNRVNAIMYTKKHFLFFRCQQIIILTHGQ
jgi:hypothetical protein